MNILIFSITYFPYVGGAEVAVHEITDRIGKPHPDPLLKGEGVFVKFDLITAKLDKKLPDFEKIGNVNVYRVGWGLKIDKYLYPLLAFRKAVKLHHQKNYEIAEAIMAFYGGLAALFFKWKYPEVKYLLNMQSGDSDWFVFLRTWFWHPIYKQIYTKADFIQPISNWLAKRARRYGYQGEIKIVPNGVDANKFSIFNFKFQKNIKYQISNFKKEFRKKIGISEDDKVIITASRLVEKNGVDDLIKSVKEIEKFQPEALRPPMAGDQPLAEEIGNWKLVSPPLPPPPKFWCGGLQGGARGGIKLLIAGTGKLENKLRRLTKELNLQDNVIFLGQISQNELPQYLWASDIFCRPSLSEGLGISFLEAMAAGLPVVATPVGGIPDFLKDGETGLFCKVHDPKSIADAVARLLSDKVLYAKIVENGRRLAEERYDWDEIAKNMSNIYSKLVA